MNHWNTGMRRNAWLIGVALLTLPVSSVGAQTALPVLAAAPSQLRVDGQLGEWRGARFTRIGDDPTGSAEVALAYDSRGLFIAARVRDEAFVRSARPGTREDAIVATLAFPVRGRFVANELWLFAGQIGKSAASAQLREGTGNNLRPLRTGVQVIEGPSPGGYALEAFVPWRDFAGGDEWSFARGAVRLHDVDPGRPDAREPSSAALQLEAAKLPWLAFDGGAAQALESFVRAKDLGAATPKLDAVADVLGDARAERVLVLGGFVLVSSAAGQFTFADLPVNSAADLQRAELSDLTGDGKPELVLRVRQRNDLGTRELVRVLGLAGDAPTALFGVESRRETRDGSVQANVRFGGPARGPTEIVVTAGEARGLSADNFVETPAGDVIAIPLPWGAWRERVYAWDGQRFALRQERANPGAATRLAAPARTTGPSAAESREDPPVRAARVQQGASAAAPWDAYKLARGVGTEVSPRFAQRADVAGDAGVEWLAVFGRELVVSGDGLGGAVGFFYLGLPVQDAADVLSVQTGDLTGDGRRDVVARVRQRIGDVQRELLFCYTLSGQAAQQLLAVEVSRVRAGQRIDNRWALVPDKQRMVLTIEPGVARGWSAVDYPFVAESLDGVGALLLPWKDRAVRYVFDRNRLAPEPRTSN